VVAAWLSGSALVSINEVILRRARLVLGCVTTCGRVNPRLSSRQYHESHGKPPRFVASHSGELSGTGNEYRLKCGDALRLRSKGRYSSFHLWINLCDSSLKHAIPKSFRDEFLIIKRYTNLPLLYFTYFTLLYYPTTHKTRQPCEMFVLKKPPCPRAE